jgi:hypothetical protein
MNNIKKARIVVFLFLVMLPWHARTGAASDGSPDQVELNVESRKAMVEKIAVLLNANYVYPEVGEKMARHIRRQLETGGYASIGRSTALARRLQAELRDICHDRHLRVVYDPAAAAALLKGGDEARQRQHRRSEEWRRQNYGFEKIERLAGNIGYLDLPFFADTEYARDTAAAAMALLAHSDALIIDLRFNGGGSPRMVQFLCSYFFGPEPVHLNSLYWRPTNHTDEFWTLKDLPGRRMPSVELFILTSSRTFSGAEEFTYNLKNLKRATVVGETTGGGAHPVNQRAVNDTLVIFIPVGRAINPITKTNWEGIGIEPDVIASREDARAIGHLLALQKVAAKTEDSSWRKRLNGLIRQIERDLGAESKK